MILLEYRQGPHCSPIACSSGIDAAVKSIDSINPTVALLSSARTVCMNVPL